MLRQSFWEDFDVKVALPFSTHNMGELQLSGKSTNYWSLQCLEGIYATTVSVTPDPSSHRLTAAVMAHTLEKPQITATTPQPANIIYLIIIFSAWLADSALTLRQTTSAYQNKGQQSKITPLCSLLPLTCHHVLYHHLYSYSPWPPFSILIKMYFLYLQAFAIINVSWVAVEKLWLWLIFLCLRVIDAREKPARFHSPSESGWKIEH